MRKRTPLSDVKTVTENAGLIFDHVEYAAQNKGCTIVYYYCSKHHNRGLQSKPLQKIKQGHSCIYCCKSLGEKAIEQYLMDRNIEFESQKRFKDLRGVGGLPLSYDFFLHKYNCLIEFQGRQHEMPVSLFQKNKDQFSVQKEHDYRKKEYAQEHGYDLLEVWYKDLDNIPQIINSYVTRCENGS